MLECYVKPAIGQTINFLQIVLIMLDAWCKDFRILKLQ
jgi:hypothetical protein